MTAARGIVTAVERGGRCAITTDSIAPDAPDALHCYRHPDRETYVSCGRCDRPICTGCAMLGPVGMRCRDCGKPAYDPLTSLTPQQLLLGLGIAVVGGTIAAFIASRIGFFSIIISFFAGGIIAEAVMRAIGLKHGPRILALVFTGIVIGAVVGFGIDVAMTTADLNAIAADVAAQAGVDPADVADATGAFPLGSMLVDMATWAAVSAGAACVGAWSRLR